MRIGDLAPERGQRDRGQDEDDRREQDLEARVLAPKRKRMSIASMLRTKLSLNAEKNWHQNSGANRRDVIKVRNMMAAAPGNGSGWTPEI